MSTGAVQYFFEVFNFIFTFKKAVSDGPELLLCIMLSLDGRLLLGGRAVVDLKVHVVLLWFEFFHVLLSKNNVAAERRLRQTVRELQDPEGIEEPPTDQVGVQDHLVTSD